MHLIATLLTLLALALAPSAPVHKVALAQPAEPSATAQIQIVEPGSSHLVVFSVVYTLTVTWPSTTVVTTTTTIPSYLIVAEAPGCTHIGNRVGCTVEAQAGLPAEIVLRFAVPWDVRGTVAISSTAEDGSGGEAAAGASFTVPGQMRLPIVLR